MNETNSMKGLSTEGLICPLCGRSLSDGITTLFCASGHGFDIAAAGYCNLLRPGKKNNAKAGDDKDMVAARGRFLSAGYYGKALDYIASQLEHSRVLVDAGCGDGYYTNGAAEKNPGLRALGIDASKHATSAAAKSAHRLGFDEGGRVRYVTATLADMPVADGYADAVLSMFAPCDYEEFARVTEDDGILIIGSAGASHLREMKAILYGEENVRDNVPIRHGELAAPAGYELVSRESVTYTTTIVGGDHIAALYNMTPYRWRSPRSGEELLLALERLDVTVDIDFTVLRKTKITQDEEAVNG